MEHAVTIRPFLWGAFSVALAIVGQFRLRDDYIFDAVLLTAIAALIFLRTFHNRDRWLWEPGGLEELTALSSRSRSASWVGLLLLVAALAAAFIALRGFHADDTPDLRVWYFHIGAIALFLAAGFCVDIGRLRPAPDAAALDSRNWFLFATLALGLVLRLYRFNDLPLGTWYDEAENGIQALRVLQSADYWPIFVSSIHAPAHYIYLIAASFELFDVSTQSIRLVSVAMGLGTIAAGFLVGRELFGRRGGLLLAFLFAVSRWDINLSRIGMYNISTPFFALLTFGFMLRALRTQRILDWTLAGLALGLGLCFYSAFQLFAGVVALYLLHLLIVRRQFLRRYGLGVGAMLLMSALIFAPVLLYAYDNPDDYFGRARDTSIFSDKTPEQRLPALLTNARKHLLMFHYVGDPNGRHNLPGEPMLDPYSGALMVLGLLISLWYLRASSWFIMPLWLLVMLLAGILSLDFEAPQSLRAVGTLPAAYILAAMPLALLGRAWQLSDGRYYPRFYAWALALLLIPLLASNVRTYFGLQANDFASWNAFSTPETITAAMLNQLDDETDPYVISFYHGHPTLNFLTGFNRNYRRLETTDQLPLEFDPERNALLIMDGERQALFEEAKTLYPTATFEEIRPPFGGPTVVYAVRLSRQDIGAIQGLTATYYANAGWAGTPAVVRREDDMDFDWGLDAPLQAPFTAQWEGVLRVGEYGLHQFSVESSGPVELLIDEAEIVAGEGELSTAITLARGNHAIRLRAAVPDTNGASRLQVAWRPPDRGPEVLPARVLYSRPVTANGLLGRYFPNGEWRGPEAFAQIDPLLNLYFHIIPLPRPYTVEWSGKIAIPQEGVYRFGLESIDESTLYIDGIEITGSPNPNQYAEGEIALSGGLHDIRILYADRTDHTHINLYWTPPWGQHQETPSQVLFPPQADYAHVEMPPLSALQLATGAPTLPGVNRWPNAQAEVLFRGLDRPKGMAIAADGTIYVADTGNRRVLILDGAGALLAEIKGPGAGTTPADFVEPFDVAVSAEGMLYVLDPGAGHITTYERDGRFVSVLPLAQGIAERSRGIGMDPFGNLWLAQTAAGRVVALSAEGATVREIPVWPGEESQPVDVAVLSDGSIYVADSGLQKLVRFSAAGQRTLAWEIPVANSVDGSHLAVDGADRLIMSYPERGEIARRNLIGDQDAGWKLQVEGAQIVKPIGVGVGPDGSLWAVDTHNGTLLRIPGPAE